MYILYYLYMYIFLTQVLVVTNRTSRPEETCSGPTQFLQSHPKHSSSWFGRPYKILHLLFWKQLPSSLQVCTQYTILNVQAQGHTYETSADCLIFSPASKGRGCLTQKYILLLLETNFQISTPEMGIFQESETIHKQIVLIFFYPHEESHEGLRATVLQFQTL